MAVTVARVGGRPLGMTYTALAATCWSLAGILQRQLHMSLATQLAGRAVFAVLAVLGFVAIAERGQLLRAFRVIGRPGLAIAVLIAIASVTFISALNDAPVADVVVVQALSPLAAALLGILGGELVRPRTWAAMAIAVAGFAVMAGGPGRPGLAGLSLSFISMLAFAATVVIARHNAHVSMAPATCLSQVLVLAVFAPFSHPGEIHGPASATWSCSAPCRWDWGCSSSRSARGSSRPPKSPSSRSLKMSWVRCGCGWRASSIRPPPRSSAASS